MSSCPEKLSGAKGATGPVCVHVEADANSARPSLDIAHCNINELLVSKAAKGFQPHEYDDDDGEEFAEAFASHNFGAGQTLRMTSSVAFAFCTALSAAAVLLRGF